MMMREIANPSVSIQDLSLSYGAVSVLQTLNLDIAEGEFIVLLGPSGCGKSTLLNCIAGLLDISKGRVFIKGKNVTWEEPKDRGIGMVFQSYALYPQMTVQGNLSFGLRVAGVAKDEIARRIARAAEILQIEPLLQRKPSALSGGQRQRVAIGRALVRDVDVFLFDEPLSNLDAKLRAELRVEIKLLHRKLRNTMIYVTHDQIEAMTLADRIAVMKGGVIQQLDAPQTIYNRPVNRFVASFLGSPAMNFLPGHVEGGTAFKSADLSIPHSAVMPSTRVATAADQACSASGPSMSPSARRPTACPLSPTPRSRSSSRWVRTPSSGPGSAVAISPSGSRLKRRSAPAMRSGSASIPPVRRCSTANPATVCSLNRSPSPSKRTETMNWSFQLYSARNFQPWERVLATLGRLGYTQVEGFGGVYADPKAFRAELDRNGLAMPTGHFSIEALENDFDGVRKTADALGITLLICPYLVAEARPSDAAGWRDFGARLAKVGAVAKNAGYGFAWHNHDFEFKKLADGSVPQEIILESAPDIGWEMDVAWVVRGGTDPLPWIDRYGKRIAAVHVKDIASPGEGLDEDGWSDVGHGTIDWAGLIKALRAKSAAEYYVMEQDNPNDIERFASRSIAAVKTYEG
jgi:multiple sugar transport system ATP-binding protein